MWILSTLGESHELSSLGTYLDGVLSVEQQWLHQIRRCCFLRSRIGIVLRYAIEVLALYGMRKGVCETVRASE